MSAADDGATGLSGSSGAPTVTDVADRYVADLAEVDAAAARALGQPARSLLPRLGPGPVAARRDLAAAALTALQAATPRDGREQVLRAAMAERLGSEVELHDSGFTPGLVAPLASPAHALVHALSVLPGEDEALLGGLRGIPAAWADLQATLGSTSATGYTVPARQSRVLAAQLRRWAGGDDDRFGPVAARLSPAARQSAAGEQALQRARRATADFADWLERVHARRGPERDAVGSELYAVTARAFLGEDIDPGETYAYGFDLLRRLTDEAEQLARRLGYDGVAQAARALDRRHRRVGVGPPLTGWAAGRIADAAARVARVVSVPGAVSRVGVELAAPGSGAIHYVPGGGADEPDARVVWAPPPGVTEMPVWREVSTVHHEGVPGHHLQHVVTAGLTDLHPWQRHLCHVHGYAEGWAHYAETRSDGWGLLHDDAERLGLVLARRWRAARVVIDLGLHLGLEVSEGATAVPPGEWSAATAAQVLVDVAGLDPSTAAFEVDRYYGWPGQALAFCVGARLWEQARVRAVGEATSAEREREFHDRALGLGPMGLKVLSELLR